MSCRAAGAGVDTWAACWYVPPGSMAGRELDDAATVASRRGRLLPAPTRSGHRVLWSSATGLLKVEGHPGAVLGRDGLCSPRELPAAFDGLVGELYDVGVAVPEGRTAALWDAAAGGGSIGQRLAGFAGIARLDSTADVRTQSAAEGFAVLAGLAAVARDMPRTKANVWFGGDGRVQTVALHGYGGGRLLGRVYDKGAESGVAPPGRLLRPEDQRRWTKDGRRDVGELTGAYVREKFHQRFRPLWQASRGVTVGGPVILSQKLAAAVEAGEISREQARNLAGELLLDLAQSAATQPSRRTRYRHRAIMRRYGLVVADGVLQEVEVDLASVLEAALDSPGWGAEG